jgi:UDP-N-acetylmuramoyl-tripeptide--D-alanyl-D-alanine ligase
MTIFLIIIFAICGIYMLLNFKYDLQMLQQNSYRISRYWKWQKDHTADMTRLVDIALLFLLFSILLKPRLSAIIIALVAIIKVCIALRKKYKKPLVFTKRVWRLYVTTGIISVIPYIALCIMGFRGLLDGLWTQENEVVIPLGFCLFVSAFSWAFVMLALIILKPVEKSINSKYYRQAQTILQSMPELKIIGITGSFGKTSTKHYLYRILSEEFDTLMTPGSYNTPMGVIRTVREMMQPHCQVFICEMGAKQIGDIKEICDLVHPQMGIITAVGPMHLESFKTIENVQSTKFELADALPSDGLVIVNNDFEYCANRAVNNTNVIRYAVSNPDEADYTASDVKYTPQGSTFTIKGKDGFEINLSTQLVGECNISNLIAAVIMALKLGVPAQKIRYAVSKIEQVEHRLNLKRTAGGVTIIDDAFNSNPTGAGMALDVLSEFKGGKRIIVTPGMIELGERQFELNKELGTKIAGKADVAIIVGQYNRDAIVSGIRNTDFEESNLHIVESFNDAQKLLADILRSGDTVLYENDLPDTFK